MAGYPFIEKLYFADFINGKGFAFHHDVRVPYLWETRREISYVVHNVNYFSQRFTHISYNRRHSVNAFTTEQIYEIGFSSLSQTR